MTTQPPLPGDPNDPHRPGQPWSVPGGGPVRGTDGSSPGILGAPPPGPRGHSVAALIAAGLGVAVVFFGVGFGVSALTHSASSSAAASPPATSAPVSITSPSTAGSGNPSAAATSKGRGKKGDAVPHIEGTLTTVGATSWTLRTTAGQSVQVSIDASTAFGTKKKTETAADFPVGTRVLVQLAARPGADVTSVHAVRVVKAAAEQPKTVDSRPTTGSTATTSTG